MNFSHTKQGLLIEGLDEQIDDKEKKSFKKDSFTCYKKDFLLVPVPFCGGNV